MKPTNNEIRIVQFIHPGLEHRPSRKILKTGIYPWNYSGHHRKFMRAHGAYVDNNEVVKEDWVYLWGEWEPTSKVSAIKPANHAGDFPEFLHEPIFFPKNYPPYSIPKKDPKLYHRQNTDPFIFGNHFIYSLCKQDRYNVLRTLAPGSIVLFGSSRDIKTRDPYFALDTVLVVKNAIRYVPDSHKTTISNVIPSHYDKIMGFEDWNDQNPKNLYHGVNFEERSDFAGMYSFVPCRTETEGQYGFERVKIRNSDLDFITNNLSQGIKNFNSTLKKNTEVWKTICKIIESQKCLRGVYFTYAVQ